MSLTALAGNMATGTYAAPWTAWQSSQWQKNCAMGSPLNST
jgi:hypothetical protein